MSQRVIAISSLLKPVYDTRMHDKIALSLAKTNKYAIKIIGFPSKKKINNTNITYTQVKPFKRLSIGRWLTPWKILGFYIKVKPELILTNSIDLLIVSILYKILFGCKVVYDIEEDYRLTFLHRRKLNILVKYLLAYSLRIKETVSAHFIDHFLLAEKIYEKNLPFISKRYTILENKSLLEPIKRIETTEVVSKKLTFSYTGTINAFYGLQDVIKFAECIRETSHQIHICGVCRNPNDYYKITEYAKYNSNIFLFISSNPVDFKDIEQVIIRSDIGLMPYKIDPAVQYKIPTKFYDYLALNKPFISSINPYWEEILGHIPFYQSLNFDELTLEKVQKTAFNSFRNPISLDSHLFRWETQETALQRTISSLIG